MGLDLDVDPGASGCVGSDLLCFRGGAAKTRLVSAAVSSTSECKCNQRVSNKGIYLALVGSNWSNLSGTYSSLLGLFGAIWTLCNYLYGSRAQGAPDA